MLFDPDNPVLQHCAEGMAAEGEGRIDEAKRLFEQAWSEAVTDLEKATAAHYVARHQNSVAGKLKWDLTALEFGLRLPDDQAKALLPSLHLNVAKCHEDLEQPTHALAHYKQAQVYAAYLPDDGYGRMIRAGIEAGVERVDRSR
jgi:tetratricopeptide (TPR) repeat protein